MKNLKRLDNIEEKEMSTRVDLIAILTPIKKLVEESNDPKQAVLDYINEVLKNI